MSRRIPKHITKDLIHRLYVQENKSVSSVGKIVGKSGKQVSRYLEKFGISARPFSTKGLAVNLGVKFSESRKEKIRQKALGRRIPPEVRMKMGSKGIKNPGYIDGRTPQNKLIRHSVEYRLWREAIFSRDNWTCRFCGQRGGNLNADHIKPFALFPELRFAIDNGRTLCVECHRKTDTYGKNLKGQNK